MKYFLLMLFMLGSSMVNATVKEIESKDGDTVLRGKLVYQNKFNEKLPTVVILHNWMGISDETMQKAEEMSKAGMNAFVADIYGVGHTPKNAEEAKNISTRFKGDLPLLRKRVDIAVNEMKKLNVKNIFVAGYCFGGTAAIEYARTGNPFNGVITFHGGLSASADDAKIKVPLLILHGAIDPTMSKADVDNFLANLNKNNIDYNFVSYSGAVHSFTDTTRQGANANGQSAYNAIADKRSWQSFKLFVEELSK